MTAPTNRRRFLLNAAGGAVAALTPAALAAAEEKAPPESASELPRRPFGATGAKVTVLGLGCFPLGSLRDEQAGVDVVLRALGAGCNYIDTAPSYSGGKSETRVGLALASFGRERFAAMGGVLASKTHTRTRDDAWSDLEGSLKRLQVERLDVWQIHAIRDADDMRTALDDKHGPLKAALEAREKKLIRWIGVTGHWDPAVMRSTFEAFPFDSILFPLNCVDPSYETKPAAGAAPERLSFVDDTLPAAVKKGLARVAMKAFASGRLPKNGMSAEDCLRFTYGLDIATCIVGCKDAAEVDLAVRVAREDRPLSPAERKRVLEEARRWRGKQTEWYKRP